MCPMVDLDYGPPRPENEEPGWHGYTPTLRISLMAASCSEGESYLEFSEEDAGPAETVRVGPYQATVRSVRIPAPDDMQMLNIRFTAGDVVVDADTTLPREQALAALATLAPLDLASQPIERVEVPTGG